MSSSAPRTKPWEVASGTSAAAATGDQAIASSSSAAAVAPSATATSAGAVPIPDRPTSLTSDFTSIPETSAYGSNYGTMNNYGSRYGMGGYGSGMYGSSMYGSGYGGYGSGMYGSSMYGGGMYGSGMYGGYGGGMYGGAGGMYGQQPGGMNPLGEGTQATFQLIESIIGAVGGFAQMLEATYMATHSSFFTMVSLAEQFGNLKNALGSLLGIFALIKFVKKMLYKLMGKTYNNGLNIKEFGKFEKNQKKLEDSLKRQQQQSSSGKPKISFKPLLLFLAASIGFPYLLSKAIQKLNEQNQRRLQQQQNGPQGSPLDPANLQFAKTLYEFNPENPNIEIELKPNELVAILSKLDPVGNESKWWKVRSRSGKVGYVPSNYLSVIERRPELIQPAPAAQAPKETEIPGGFEKPEKLVEEFKGI
ncbi:uncharacterized protein SPAPADRAFT_59186 [Spathaspora passalidarum NRRL Y-27907]|uniref:Peroxisomal membrane protein PEX13 n=1 Tax=Spathaspora passalidarum (strain NRRL Y-27907 / 11-Y1) TaxID=619300 RepID=G3AJ71_SPAPN|nr:uncharacterized protein SPAPADRAFT_59186 [Spathaspora passalidarum NRRL Y-27907]EGW33828.1 hypothetical protein SPAPADRAFT_59186 [Spathaspora passalidarum NRRL Y-27907]